MTSKYIVRRKVALFIDRCLSEIGDLPYQRIPDSEPVVAPLEKLPAPLVLQRLEEGSFSTPMQALQKLRKIP